MAALGDKGIVLTNYFGATHPSEPQYFAIHGGDNFGMDQDNFQQIPSNVSTIGIFWTQREYLLVDTRRICHTRVRGLPVS
jgi:hypothetical protein